MKARIKATGEIVELAPYTRVCEDFAKGRSWLVEELDDADDVTDYWTRLEHQYAGMAMQALLSSDTMMGVLSRRDNGTMEEEVAIEAFDYAHALVEKYKKEERK